MYRVAQLENLDDPRAVKAENAIAEAFHNNNEFRVLTEGNAELLHLLYRTGVRAGIVGGKFYVAMTEKDEVIGTALWYPSGRDYLADEQQQREGGTELLSGIARVNPKLSEWWMNTLLPLNAETSNKFLGKDFKLHNWSLYFLGVVPEHRRKGVARMLLKAGEDEAAAHGASTCLETETEENLNIYGRLGYKTVGHIFIPGLHEGDGFDFHTLVKYSSEGAKAESA